RDYRIGRRCLVAVDGRDRVIAYLRWACPAPERFAGLEMAATDPAAWGSLARALGRRARRRGVHEVRFRLPLDL
ncbi:MAG: hypothetical protein AAF512_05670, partial [Pseudomonadota bacterium]